MALLFCSTVKKPVSVFTPNSLHEKLCMRSTVWAKWRGKGQHVQMKQFLVLSITFTTLKMPSRKSIWLSALERELLWWVSKMLCVTEGERDKRRAKAYILCGSLGENGALLMWTTKDTRTQINWHCGKRTHMPVCSCTHACARKRTWISTIKSTMTDLLISFLSLALISISLKEE